MIKENEYHNIVFAETIRQQVDIQGNAQGYDGTIKFDNFAMGEVVVELAKANPTWRLMITRGYVREFFKCVEVKVLIGGEEVGAIKGTYVRGNNGVFIQGNRLDPSIRSSNVKRALSACRKGFVKRNTTEMLNLAEIEAQSTVNGAHMDMSRNVSRLTHDISAHAFKYAMEKIREQFVSNLLENDRQLIHRYDGAVANMLTIDEVKKSMDADKTALVVRDGERYIVKVGDAVALYAAAELPEGMRGKVGMLKLCADGQMVDHVGCRVSNEVFVVLVSEGASDAE